MKTSAFCLVWMLALTLVQAATAQPSTLPTSIPLPEKPDDILKLALMTNGLDKPSDRPWHIKLTYDEFDEDGDNIHSGTFEEFYSGPRKYRQSYAGDTLNQTDVATDAGLYRSGDQTWPKGPELQVRNEALRPLYRAQTDLPNSRLDKMKWPIQTATGDQKLPCLVIRGQGFNNENGMPKFCFDPGTVRLRYTRGKGWDETAYNDVTLLQGHYIARKIIVLHAGKAFLKINVEELESPDRLDESLFKPPAGSSGPLSGPIENPSIMDEYLVSTAIPSIPRGVQGKVNVNFVVGKDGSVIEAEAVDGPVDLRAAVVEAVRRFKFRPFLILDQPVEVRAHTFFEVH